jgi:hypothetical protein
MDARQERRAKNEALFREVNERIVEISKGLTGYGENESLLAGFVCECSREDCTKSLDVTHAQYEAVRDDPRRFVILPGHEDTTVDRVVERHPSFLVVQKFGEASKIARERDPRS